MIKRLFSRVTTDLYNKINKIFYRQRLKSLFGVWYAVVKLGLVNNPSLELELIWNRKNRFYNRSVDSRVQANFVSLEMSCGGFQAICPLNLNLHFPKLFVSNSLINWFDFQSIYEKLVFGCRLGLSFISRALRSYSKLVSHLLLLSLYLLQSFSVGR